MGLHVKLIYLIPGFALFVQLFEVLFNLLDDPFLFIFVKFFIQLFEICLDLPNDLFFSPFLDAWNIVNDPVDFLTEGIVKSFLLDFVIWIFLKFFVCLSNFYLFLCKLNLKLSFIDFKLTLILVLKLVLLFRFDLYLHFCSSLCSIPPELLYDVLDLDQ